MAQAGSFNLAVMAPRLMVNHYHRQVLVSRHILIFVFSDCVTFPSLCFWDLGSSVAVLYRGIGNQ